MSRSRKRVTIWKQPNSRYYKRLSNKRIRKADIQSGGMFKRVMDTYDICDWRWFGPSCIDAEKSKEEIGNEGNKV